MTHKEVVEKYIKDVMSGAIITGRLAKLAVRRHLADLKNAGQRGFYFDETIAEEACSFFPNVLRHSTGDWVDKPFDLTPCQAFVTWCLFGWRRAENGLRRFRRAYVSWARKNGKTTWCAGTALLVLALDNPIEHGAQVYVAATKEEQANIMHKEAICMVNKSPSLSKISIVNKKNIAIPKLNSFFRPLGSDSKTNAGWNPHAVFLDEICDWQEHHRGLWGALTTGSVARGQPLRMSICTAGDDDSPIWEKEDEFATNVVESVVTGVIIDDWYFTFIARIDDERVCESCDGQGCGKCANGMLPADDPLDEACWIKANPNLGYNVRPDNLREMANEAKHKPTAMNDFIRYHCNRRCSSNEKAIKPELWSRCGGSLRTWTGESYGAFDLGRKSDLASIAIVQKFSDDEGDRFECRQWSFTHKEVNLPLHQEPWSTFIRRGSLLVNSGNVIDLPGAFKDKLLEVTSEFNVVQWAYDPNNAAYLGILLNNELGIEAFEFRQTHAMYNETMDEFLKAIKAGTICHGDDPLLTFSSQHLVINKNSKNEWMPKKDVSSGKIDPMVATIMAFGGAMKSDGSLSGYWNPAIGV